VAEVEVLTDHDQAGLQRVHQDRLDEVLGGLVGPLPVEGDHDGAIDAAVSQELQLLLLVGQLLGRRLWPHHVGRMAVEGDHDGGEPLGRGEGRQLAQKSSMPQVHAVVRADRDSGSGHRG
jgi:hypothetical protein